MIKNSYTPVTSYQPASTARRFLYAPKWELEIKIQTGKRTKDLTQKRAEKIRTTKNRLATCGFPNNSD